MTRHYGMLCASIALIISILLSVSAHPSPAKRSGAARAKTALRLDSANPCSAARHAERLGIKCETLGEESGLLFAVALLRCRTPEKWNPKCEILHVEDISKCILDDKYMDVLNLIWIPYVEISRFCYKQGEFGTVKRMLKVVEKGMRKRYPKNTMQVPHIGPSTRLDLFGAYVLVIFLGLVAFRKPTKALLVLELSIHGVSFYLIGRIYTSLQVKNALRAMLFLTFISSIPLQIYLKTRIVRERRERRAKSS